MVGYKLLFEVAVNFTPWSQGVLGARGRAIVFEGHANYYLLPHFTSEETAGPVAGSPMTRLNQTFFFLRPRSLLVFLSYA